MRFLLLLAAVPLPASAADRTVAVSSFTRVRVEGPFTVEVVTGASPAARASGERDAIERVDVVQSGETVTVRAGTGWGERDPGRPARPVTVTLATPQLQGVAIGAGAEVRAGAMKGDRVDLTVTGAGKLTVAAVDADQLVATVVGAGALSAAGGRAGTARLMVSGPGTIDAPAVVAGDLSARVEGTGALTAAARYTAQVTATGLGKVTVLGRPKCTVRAPAGAPVTCGG